jgi:integrase
VSALKSKDARLKLHRWMVKTGGAGDISWESIGKGRAVGYRRLEGSPTGQFYARLYDRKRVGSPYHRHSIGAADDTGMANGCDILSFSQALKKASTFDPWGHDEGDDAITVADACNVYLEWSESNRPNSHPTVKSLFSCHLFSDGIASIPVTRLTLRRLEQWKSKLAEKPRSHISGELQAAANEDELKSRKVSANHTVAWLKAALNFSKRCGFLTCDDTAWRLLRPFKAVSRSGRRGQAAYLSEKQLGLLLEAIDDEAFSNLVQGAVFTGARYSELSRLRVGDLDPDNGTVTVVSGKGGKTRNIFLGDNATRLLTHLCAGRPNDERIFLKANGKPWGKSHQQKRLERAITAAGIRPRISFHGLRATYASLYLMGGGDIFGLAKQLGHSSTQMLNQHYGHLANHHRQEQARACEPQIPTPDVATREERLH